MPRMASRRRGGFYCQKNNRHKQRRGPRRHHRENLLLDIKVVAAQVLVRCGKVLSGTRILLVQYLYYRRSSSRIPTSLSVEGYL